MRNFVPERVVRATGRMMRSEECRNVQCAVTLEIKLSSDTRFADMWVRDGDPKSPEVKRHGLEREWTVQ